MAIIIVTSQPEVDSIPDPKHIWLDGDRVVVYTEEDFPDSITKPAIEIPSHIAKIALNRAGILNKVIAGAKAFGIEAEIAFTSAPFIRSDNALVSLVLGPGGLGMTSDEIYRLFVDAQNIKI